MNLDALLESFVEESNGIEEIYRDPTQKELEAHERAFKPQPLSLAEMEDFVFEIAGERLRRNEGQDVIVGAHTAPFGGPEIEARLVALLNKTAGDFKTGDPFAIHVAYEHLHPFMDGNGRSGRFLWLWMMCNAGRLDEIWRYGFRRCWYYQSLEAYDNTKPSS